MKKVLLFLLIFTNVLFAMSITLNSLRENSSDYQVLHIADDKPFSCKKKFIDIKNIEFICIVNKEPIADIKPKETKFVKISINNIKSATKIVIKPKKRVQVYSENRTLYEKDIISNANPKKAKHWFFILYDQSFLKKSKKDSGINFPIHYNREKLPHIGALDLNGIPIKYIHNNKDIDTYLTIKDDFSKKQYTFVVREADKAIKKYPNSIFLNDFLLYKLRAMDRINISQMPESTDNKFETIIKIGKKWIKSFPSNQNIPEVLYYIAKAYQEIGQSTEAKYFFDILISEHPKNRYTKLAVLLFADNLLSENQSKKAVELYKEVLYSTKDINIASIAAKKLADFYFKSKDYKRAMKYYQKIIDANPSFFLKDINKTYDLAVKTASNHMENFSIKLFELLLKKVKKDRDLKENITKKLADAYYSIKNYKKALYYYKLYLSKYRYGIYYDLVKKRIDEMFFDTNEKNTTKLLMHYDRLMKKYPAGKIYQKAATLKAKLLIKEKEYKKCIDFLNSIDSEIADKKVVERLKKDAAKHIVIDDLKAENCSEAIQIKEKYKIKVDKKHLKKLSICYISTFNPKKASKLIENVLKKEKLFYKDRYEWLLLLAKSLYLSKKYKKLIDVCNDIIDISQAYSLNTPYDIYYYKFFALYSEKNFNEALKLVANIEKKYPNNFKNSEIFYKLAKYANTIDNSLMTMNFASKAIELQNRYKSYILSPDIEFLYISAAKKSQKLQNAKKIALSLLNRVDNEVLKARLYYELGDISVKSNNKEQAKKYFRLCTDLKKDSAWKSLCKESIELF